MFGEDNNSDIDDDDIMALLDAPIMSRLNNSNEKGDNTSSTKNTKSKKKKKKKSLEGETDDGGNIVKKKEVSWEDERSLLGRKQKGGLSDKGTTSIQDELEQKVISLDSKNNTRNNATSSKPTRLRQQMRNNRTSNFSYSSMSIMDNADPDSADAADEDENSSDLTLSNSSPERRETTLSSRSSPSLSVRNDTIATTSNRTKNDIIDTQQKFNQMTNKVANVRPRRENQSTSSLSEVSYNNNENNNQQTSSSSNARSIQMMLEAHKQEMKQSFQSVTFSIQQQQQTHQQPLIALLEQLQVQVKEIQQNLQQKKSKEDLSRRKQQEEHYEKQVEEVEQQKELLQKEKDKLATEQKQFHKLHESLFKERDEKFGLILQGMEDHKEQMNQHNSMKEQYMTKKEEFLDNQKSFLEDRLNDFIKKETEFTLLKEKVTRDKTDFDREKANWTSQMKIREENFQRERKALHKLQENIEYESNMLERRKEEAKTGLLSAKSLQSNIKEENDQIQVDKIELQKTRDFLEQKESSLQKQKEEIQQKLEAAESFLKQGQELQEQVVKDRKILEIEKQELKLEIEKVEKLRVNTVYENTLLIRHRNNNNKINDSIQNNSTRSTIPFHPILNPSRMEYITNSQNNGNTTICSNHNIQASKASTDFSRQALASIQNQLNGINL